METTAIDSLTDRQARFVFEYLKDQNASAAAERAGYSARSRASQAGELMNMPAVRERIRIEMQSLLAELRLSALDLMKARMRAAFFRAGQLFNASGELLGLEEMEAEVRDSLVIHAKLRKGEKELSFRSPNREPALRALERVHERLEKLNEAHYAALEKQRSGAAGYPGQEAAQGGMPAGMWAGLNLNEPAPASGPGAADAPGRAPAQQGGGQGDAPAPVAPLDKTAEISQVRQADFYQGCYSGATNTTVVQVPAATDPVGEFAEISQVFSGSPEKPAKPSLLSKALAALSPGKKEDMPPALASAPLPVRGANNPGAPLIRRHDSSLMWGGPPKHTPPPPSPALLEHLASLKREEFNAQVKREMELRGGKIRPGEVKPAYPPGFNPPWMRDQRPKYAIGAGEFYFSGEEPEE